MNRNTLTAFALILATIWFFNSDIYYERILRRPHPGKATRQTQQKALQDKTEQSQPAPQVNPPSPEAFTEEKFTEKAKEPKPSEPVASLEESITTEQEDTVWVETDKFICGISLHGGRIISLRTKEYHYGSRTTDDPKSKVSPEMIELVPQNGPGGANLKIGSIDYDNVLFEPNVKELKLGDGSGNKGSIELIHMDRGAPVVKRFSFEQGSYRIGYTVESPHMANASVTAGWRAGISESEAQTAGFGGGNQQRQVHIYDGSSVEHITKKKENEREVLTGAYRWVGITSKYFMIALKGEKLEDSEIGIESVVASGEAVPRGKKDAKALNYEISMKRTPEGNKAEFHIFAGPTKLSELRSYGVAFQKVLFSGWKWFLRADIWFPIISEWVLWILIALVGFLKDFGVAIIVMTILLRVVTFPMTQSSTKSMARMKDMQPKINALRQRYKADPRKMNEEIMALYRAEGINPFNPGCLPMVLQMPIFISLYVVLNKAIELRGATTFLIPWVKDLSQPEVLPLISPLPFSIPFYGSNVALLPILMAALTFVQNKMTIKDPNQKAMIYFMPLMMLFLFNNFAAGLVLYWTFSSALGIAQQWYTNRSIAKRQAVVAAATVVASRPGPKRKR